MKVKSALLGLAAASGGLLMSANVASADGYSAPARYVAPPTWTGCYVGIAGGWAWGHSEAKRLDINTTSTPVTVTTTTFASYDMDGGLIGGTAGCNLQSSGGFVLGVESDLSWIDKKGSGLDDPAVGVTNNTTEERWLETTRLRLGWAAGNFLLYATGGAAFADVKYTACSPALWLGLNPRVSGGSALRMVAAPNGSSTGTGPQRSSTCTSTSRTNSTSPRLLSASKIVPAACRSTTISYGSVSTTSWSAERRCL